MTNKLYFASDYMEGAHAVILERMARTNLNPSPGYGCDSVTESARGRIRTACACPQAAVHFLVGGTQTNATMIDALLSSYEGVLAPETGHIATHEAGAIELGGHKVLTLPHRNGKISATQVDAYCKAWAADENHEHTVLPGMVYVSQPTEYGTLYTLDELEALRTVCNAHDLRLYVDGARLAYALACPVNDVTLADLARLCDVFYLGGTKCGALFGEAVVVSNPQTLPHLFTLIKQHGALLAKGWLLGMQFDCLFENDLYVRGGAVAIAAAEVIRAALSNNGYELASNAPTNQIFVRLSNEDYQWLSQSVEVSFWERNDEDHVVVRLATSWATTQRSVDELVALLAAHKEEG